MLVWWLWFYVVLVVQMTTEVRKGHTSIFAWFVINKIHLWRPSWISDYHNIFYRNIQRPFQSSFYFIYYFAHCVLSVLRFTDSDYPFGIFTFFLQMNLMYIIIEDPALRKYMYYHMVSLNSTYNGLDGELLFNFRYRPK